MLLELKGDPEDHEFSKFREVCREKLSKLRVILHYTDSYDSHFDPYHRDLEWFGRAKGTRKNEKAN